jgi:hypothetical protein
MKRPSAVSKTRAMAMEASGAAGKEYKGKDPPSP